MLVKNEYRFERFQIDCAQWVISISVTAMKLAQQFDKPRRFGVCLRITAHQKIAMIGRKLCAKALSISHGPLCGEAGQDLPVARVPNLEHSVVSEDYLA